MKMIPCGAGEGTRAHAELNTQLSTMCDQKFFHLPWEDPAKDKTKLDASPISKRLLFSWVCLFLYYIHSMFYYPSFLLFPPSLHATLSSFLSLCLPPNVLPLLPPILLIISASMDSHLPLPHDMESKMTMTSGYKEQKHLPLICDNEKRPGAHILQCSAMLNGGGFPGRKNIRPG